MCQNARNFWCFFTFCVPTNYPPRSVRYDNVFMNCLCMCFQIPPSRRICQQQSPDVAKKNKKFSLVILFLSFPLFKSQCRTEETLSQRTDTINMRAIEFQMTGENSDKLLTIVNQFRQFYTVHNRKKFSY